MISLLLCQELEGLLSGNLLSRSVDIMGINWTIENRKPNSPFAESACCNLPCRLEIIAASAQGDRLMVPNFNFRSSANNDYGLALAVPVHWHSAITVRPHQPS